MIPVSIGMPVFNGERWISSAVESLLSQSFGDFELIIADNCSSDRTYEICRDYVAKDARVRAYRNERNLGAMANFNLVFGHASGRYFKWATSNDLCEPTFLEACKAVLDERNDVVLCHSKTRLIDEEDNIFEDYEHGLSLLDDDPISRFKKFSEIMRLNNVLQGLMRRECLGETQLLRNSCGADMELIGEMALRGKIFEVPENLFLRRIGRSASTNQMTDRELAKWFNRGADILWMPTVERMIANTRMLRRVPLQPRDKIRLSGVLLRQLNWSRSAMWAEVKEAGRRLAAKTES